MARAVPDPASVDTVTTGNRLYQTKGLEPHHIPVQEQAKPKQPAVAK